MPSREHQERCQSRRGFLQGAAALASSLAGCNHDRKRYRERQKAALWFTYGGKNRQVLEQLVSAFNEGQSRYWLDAIYQGDYYEGLAKLRTALAARVAPALSHVIGEVIPYLAEAEVLEPLADYEGATELDVLGPLGQKGTWQGGDRRPLVCLPFNRSTPIAYLNRELFERENQKAPTSWDRLVECARRLTKRDVRGRTVRHGFGCPIDWWFWVALTKQAGGTLVDERGRIVLGEAAGIEALELWQRMVTHEKTMKPPPGRDYNAWEQTNQDFLAGRTAMIWTSTAFLRYLEDNAPFSVLAAPLPGKVRRAVFTGGTHWVIPRSAPRPAKEAAWAFLRFMHEPASARTWATHTGYLPVTESAVRDLTDSGYYQTHPNDRVALEQLDVAEPWPWSPELFRIQRELVQPALEQAVLSGHDARTVLDRARRRATQELG